MTQSSGRVHPGAVILLLVLTRVFPGAAQGRGLTLVDSVQSALRGNPAVQVGREVATSAQAGREVESGAFDTATTVTVVGEHVAQPLTGFLTALAKADEQRTTTSGADLRVDRWFRSGFTLSPVLSVRRSRDNLFNLALPNAASASLVLSMPLLRGRGAAVTTAAERAAEMEYQASLLDARQAASDVVLATAEAYWAYVSAVETARILAAAEAQAGLLLDQTRILVASRTLPAADLNQLVATRADRTAARMEAEQSVIQARQTLGVAMALDTAAIAQLPEPAESFPTVPMAIPESPALFISSALTERADLLAAARRLDALQIQRTRAADDLKPRVDLTASAGYAGLTEGGGLPPFVLAFGDNVAGPNAAVALRYQGVTGNAAARGRLSSIDAQYRRVGIERDGLARRIGAEISVALSRVRTTAAALEQSEVALAAFRTAIDDERTKLRLGLSTILSVVLLEDRLTVASRRKVTEQAALAGALVELHHAIGDLVAPGDLVNARTLTTLPAASR